MKENYMIGEKDLARAYFPYYKVKVNGRMYTCKPIGFVRKCIWDAPKLLMIAYGILWYFLSLAGINLHDFFIPFMIGVIALIFLIHFVRMSMVQKGKCEIHEIE